MSAIHLDWIRARFQTDNSKVEWSSFIKAVLFQPFGTFTIHIHDEIGNTLETIKNQQFVGSTY